MLEWARRDAQRTTLHPSNAMVLTKMEGDVEVIVHILIVSMHARGNSRPRIPSHRHV